MLNNFTLIIPTHNRHNYLTRSIEYYKNAKADIIYCDSSISSYTNHLPDNVKYLHLPGESFANKILISVNQVKTNFIALCADDDFILIDSLYKGSEFLSSNPHFSTVVGRYVRFKQEFDGKFYQMYSERSADIIGNKKDRVQIFFHDYFQILWALYKKDVIEKAFNVIQKSQFKNDNFIEIILGTLCCYLGNIRFNNNIWGIREFSNCEHWGKLHKSIHEMEQWQREMDIENIRKHIDSYTSTGFFDLAVNMYLERFRNKPISIPQLMKQITPMYVKNFIYKHIYKKKQDDFLVQINEEDHKILFDIATVLSTTKINLANPIDIE